MPRDFEFRDVPLGYHITFRGHGTWLHGDERGSVDRFHNRFGSPRIPSNKRWLQHNKSQLKAPPVRLGKRRRELILEAVRETCKIRKWKLWVTNVRTNHIHTVVTAPCDPEFVLIALKANATRKLREARSWLSTRSPWAKGGSKKRLWTEKSLNNAIAYVECDQGEPLT